MIEPNMQATLIVLMAPTMLPTAAEKRVATIFINPVRLEVLLDDEATGFFNHQKSQPRSKTIAAF